MQLGTAALAMVGAHDIFGKDSKPDTSSSAVSKFKAEADHWQMVAAVAAGLALLTGTAAVMFTINAIRGQRRG